MEAVQASLSHIQEVRRRMLGSFTVSPHNLPPLSWPLPRPPNPPPARGNVSEEANAVSSMRRNEREEQEGEVLGEEQQRWRLIGGELRMVADQFQLNRSKVRITCPFHYPFAHTTLPPVPHPAESPSPLPQCPSGRTCVGGRAERVHVVVTLCG